MASPSMVRRRWTLLATSGMFWIPGDVDAKEEAKRFKQHQRLMKIQRYIQVPQIIVGISSYQKITCSKGRWQRGQ